MISKKTRIMLYLLLSAVASCVCFIFGQHLYIDSDEANYALAVQDMARGNFFLKNWVFSPDNFWTIDVAGMYALGSIFGNKPFIPHLMAALWWGGITFVSLILCNISKKDYSWQRCLPVALFLALMPLYDHGPESFISYIPYHVGTVFLGLCIFVSIQSVINGKNIPFALVMIFLFTTLISASDFFGVVVAIVPAIMALIVNARSHGAKSFVPKISTSIICGLVASKIIHIIIFKNGGFYSREIHARFLPFDELPQRAIYTIQSVLDFFGVDFLGKRVGNSLICMLRAIPFIGMVYGIFLLSKRFTIKEINNYDYLSRVFIFGFCIDFSAAFFSDFYLTKEDIIRYFLPSFIYFVLFFSRNFSIKPIAFYVPIFVTVIIYPFSYYNLSDHKSDPFHIDHQINTKYIIQALNENNVHHGYAGYWEGSLVTYESGEKVISRAIYDEHDPDHQKACNLYPHQWLSKLDWYARDNVEQEKYLFFITHDFVSKNHDGLLRRDVFNTFGSPVKSIHIGENTDIDIYEKRTVESCPNLFITYLFDKDAPPQAISKR